MYVRRSNSFFTNSNQIKYLMKVAYNFPISHFLLSFPLAAVIITQNMCKQQNFHFLSRMFREGKWNKCCINVQFSWMKKLNELDDWICSLFHIIIHIFLFSHRYIIIKKIREKWIIHLFFFNRHSETFKTCIEERSAILYFIFSNYFLSNSATYI